MHLVVLQHGLWGKALDMAYLEKVIAETCGDNTWVVNSTINEGQVSMEGIDICGDRLVELVCSCCDAPGPNGHRVDRLSLVGYSLGGLMVRYAAGKLYALGLFESVQPCSLVTIATPHLGSHRTPATRFNTFMNWLSPYIASRSGAQLLLADSFHAAGLPLLLALTQPGSPFMHALAAFQHRCLYACVRHDRTVPYCTAAITLRNPFHGATHLPVNPAFPSVVRIAQPEEPPPLTPRRMHGAMRYVLVLAMLPLMMLTLLGFVVVVARRSAALHARLAAHPPDLSWLHTTAQHIASGVVDGEGAEDGCVRLLQERSGGGGARQRRGSVEPCVAVGVKGGGECGSEDGGSSGEESAGRWRISSVHCIASEHLCRGCVENTGDAGREKVPLSVKQAAPDLMPLLVDRLNSLTWTKFDVDTAHYHAHAAVINRRDGWYPGCIDVMAHLAQGLAATQ